MSDEPRLVPTTIEATGEPAQECLLWGRVVIADRLLDHYDERALRVAIRAEARGLADDFRAELERLFHAEYERRKAARS